MLSRIAESYRQAYGAVPRNVWLISVALLVSRCGTMVIPFLPIYFSQELGFRPVVIGWLLAVYGMGGVIASVLGGWLTQRIGAIPTQISGLALSVPGYLLLGQANSFWSAWFCLFFLSLAAECQRPAAATATVDFCSSEDQHTRALAVNRLAVNLGMTLGPAVGGFLAVINYDLLFYVNAATMALSMMLLLAFFGWKIKPAATGKEQLVNQAAGSPWADRRFVI
ncbi:MAG: MFS transporter, partial [Pirellulaceae bacterium]